MATERSPVQRRAVIGELTDVFGASPGVVVMRNAVAPNVIARATAAFESLIAHEKTDGLASGDHFATPGAKDRVWNAMEKLAVTEPETFVEYCALEALELVSTAWLGPAYQVTSQLNVVNPGGVHSQPTATTTPTS